VRARLRIGSIPTPATQMSQAITQIGAAELKVVLKLIRMLAIRNYPEPCRLNFKCI